MCHSVCTLYRDCQHHSRVLTLCPPLQEKRLRKYHDQCRAQQRAKPKNPLAHFFSSPAPRPLLRPAVTFAYSSHEPPRAVTQNSCSPDKITYSTAIFPDVCAACSGSPANACAPRPPRPATADRPFPIGMSLSPSVQAPRPATSTAAGRPQPNPGQRPGRPVRPVCPVRPVEHDRPRHPLTLEEIDNVSFAMAMPPSFSPVPAPVSRRPPVLPRPPSPKNTDHIAFAMAMPPSFPIGPPALGNRRPSAMSPSFPVSPPASASRRPAGPPQPRPLRRGDSVPSTASAWERHGRPAGDRRRISPSGPSQSEWWMEPGVAARYYGGYGSR